jgi:hypothetical protein
MKYRVLPAGANLEVIKKEARKLLRAVRQSDVATAQQYRTFDVLESSSHVTLPDAQYVIARHYGFKSWTNLLENLNPRRASTASKFFVTA